MREQGEIAKEQYYVAMSKASHEKVKYMREQKREEIGNSNEKIDILEISLNVVRELIEVEKEASVIGRVLEVQNRSSQIDKGIESLETSSKFKMVRISNTKKLNRNKHAEDASLNIKTIYEINEKLLNKIIYRQVKQIEEE